VKSPKVKTTFDLNKSGDLLTVPKLNIGSGVKPQTGMNSNNNDIMRELFTGQTKGTIALPRQNA